MSANKAQVLQWLDALLATASRRSPGGTVKPVASTDPLQEGAHINAGSANAILGLTQRGVESLHSPSPLSPPPPLSTDLSPMSTSGCQELAQDSGCQPHFLSLPPELRNNVYRYAILGEEKIKINTAMTQPPQEPAMLRVNRQTRHEGLGIYYQENHFRFDMNNFDATAYMRWVQAKPIIRGRLQVWFKLYLITSPDLAWKNLMIWLEAIHARKVFHGPSDRTFPGKKKHRLLAGELKQLAANLRAQGMDWDNILATLAYSKRMLVTASANRQRV